MTERELKLKQAAQDYYTSGSSDMTDEEFDAEMALLAEETPDSELFTIGWGYSVDDDNTPGEKCPHKYGLVGSLEKARTWKELRVKGLFAEFDASVKLDGMSAVANYEDGKLVKALTRGDGIIGIDITDKIKRLIGDELPSLFTGAVRGEIVMSYDNFVEFQKLHINDKTPPKNPRNSTVGLINRPDITEDYRFLDFVVYSIIGHEDKIGDGSGYLNWMPGWLSANFKHTAEREFVKLTASNYLEVLTNLKEKWYGIYPMDGIVLNERAVFKGDYVEYTSIAFKFPSEQKDSTVLRVEFNMSKNGYAIPLIWVEPIELAGTTVQKCAGYNAKYIIDSCIGEGTVVKIQKRGEIIPNVDEVVSTPYTSDMSHQLYPHSCPSCGAEFEWEGVHLKCPNSKCPNYHEQDLIVWLQFLAPIDRLGDTLKFKFLREIFFRDLSVETVMSFKGYFGGVAKGAQQQLMIDMFNTLRGTGAIQLNTALKALNIPRLGDKCSEQLSNHPELVRACIAHATTDASYLSNVNNLVETKASLPISLRNAVGDANSKSIMSNIWKFARLRYIIDRIVWQQQAQLVDIKGKVAITGKISVKRGDFEAELRSAGYEPGDLKKDSMYLITDDPNSSSSKNGKADAWGIEKITEQEFRKRFM